MKALAGLLSGADFRHGRGGRGHADRLPPRAPTYGPALRHDVAHTAAPRRGAAIFGAGWGLYGYCPGPALTALYYGADDTLLFLLAMIGGMFIASRLPQR